MIFFIIRKSIYQTQQNPKNPYKGLKLEDFILIFSHQHKLDKYVSNLYMCNKIKELSTCLAGLEYEKEGQP